MHAWQRYSGCMHAAAEVAAEGLLHVLMLPMRHQRFMQVWVRHLVRCACDLKGAER